MNSGGSNNLSLKIKDQHPLVKGIRKGIEPLLCHKLWFSDPYIFAIQFVDLQLNSERSNNLNEKYQWLTLHIKIVEGLET